MAYWEDEAEDSEGEEDGEAAADGKAEGAEAFSTVYVHVVRRTRRTYLCCQP